jgi:hypothetical protein
MTCLMGMGLGGSGYGSDRFGGYVTGFGRLSGLSGSDRSGSRFADVVDATRGAAGAVGAGLSATLAFFFILQLCQCFEWAVMVTL